MTPAMELLGNHLWQSTLVLALAGLLVCTLRGNRAEVRYAVWLTASMKFLVPFAALAWIGHHIEWSPPTSVSNSDVIQTVQFVAQPLASTDLNVLTGFSLPPNSSTGTAFRIVMGIWLCGVAGVAGIWAFHRRRVVRMVRTTPVVVSGREAELLRGLEIMAGIKGPVPLVLCTGSREPALFGLVRPVLLWPEALSAHLTDEHIEAILAHELSHLRRHDNLTAALHMVVQAVFWFFPLVWWLGGRLLEERELACDEAVIRWGKDRRVYAESILKTCEQCLKPPLPCVTGVGRSDLNQRIEVIMREHPPQPIHLWKRIALTAAALALVALPIALGSAPATEPQAQSEPPAPAEGGPAFASASIRFNTSGLRSAQGLGFPPEGRFSAENVSLLELIKAVYGREFLAADRVVGGPDWIRSERFDVYAQAAGDPLPGQRQLMVRSLLRERFKLAMHIEHREARAYALTVSPTNTRGPSLLPSSAVCPEPGAPPPPPPAGVLPGGSICGVRRGPQALTGDDAMMWQLALLLGERLGRTVVDRTGLQGRFDFSVNWGGASNPRSAIPEALREQLGLELVSTVAKIPILVIDAAERPTADD